ncbi:MAG TPA: 4-hydroxy-3-methylbut-2-enyl diphosphate reductase [Candidatus Gastranaerophilaceae bacterium]|nr:4-hydroxy-3-methylbut-2-enyl diphosphate reductase [Candidatus Gastranaerophilaceae bacterium]HPT40899.1 4-hydroxy-3-methylbut-2-enyl diphosphate reductase [Candidatus Gastranaerophilaceae bacterium]
MSKNIKLAKHSGFCYGVKRAVETVKKLKEQNPDKNIFILGELIHNSQVIQELEDLGIKTINELPEKGSGICVIRSHGASPEIFEQITKAGFEVVDLTCPDVKKVQKKAIELVKEGYFLIIVGKAEHPEVVAIKANAQRFGADIFVASDVEQLRNIEDKIKEYKKIGVVVQTTQRVTTLKPIVEYLTSISQELSIANTICNSTTLRQNEAKNLAEESDLMIVVGSRKSANTTHLAEILKDISKTIHIEDDKELDNYKNVIKDAKNISITAGASTPEKIINNVIDKLKGEKNENS